MSLATQFNTLISELMSQEQVGAISNNDLIHCIDLTLLNSNASEHELLLLKQAAQDHKPAAICVYPDHLHYFAGISPTYLATVINFPSGDQSMDNCQADLEKSFSLHVNEIDYVIDYKEYLTGDKQKALNKYAMISQYCKNHQLLLKVILETGAFPTMQSIYELSTELIAIGCDFLKTSTGKIPQGADFAAEFAMLTAIKDSNKACGVKVSGGVKTPLQARQFALLAELILEQKINPKWFRIGASSLLDELCRLGDSHPTNNRMTQ